MQSTEEHSESPREATMDSAFFSFSSPLGKIFLVSDGTALTGLYFAGQRHLPTGIEKQLLTELPVFLEARTLLIRYFERKQPDFGSLPLAPAGTDFQKSVWALLREIPYGKTVTYKELSELLCQRTGKRSAPRAIGGAVGRNPISLLIPCHRVVGQNGSLVGYAGGLERKAALLRLENSSF